jgi:hypothetical protein
MRARDKSDERSATTNNDSVTTITLLHPRATRTMTRPLEGLPSSHEDIVVSSQSEERKGLLSGLDTFSTGTDESLSPLCHYRALFSFRLAGVVATITALLGVASGVFYWLSLPSNSINADHFNGDTLRSNGTHEFKRTVLIVSIDGLRDAISNSPRPVTLSPLILYTGPTI